MNTTENTSDVPAPAASTTGLLHQARGLTRGLKSFARDRLGRLQQSLEKRPALTSALVVVAIAALIAISLPVAWLLGATLPSDPSAVKGQIQTTTVWSRSPVIAAGDPLSPEQLNRLLSAQGFRKTDDSVVSALRVQNQEEGDRHAIQFLTAEGRLIEVEFEDETVSSLRVGGADVDHVILDPVPLAHVIGDDRFDRRPVPYADIDSDLVHAILAAEDDGFFDHHGLSISGIIRAAIDNVRAGRIEQGASTITQQVARNLYLTLERSWTRKLREAQLAVAMDRKWTKEEIFQSYANIVYLGSRFSRQLIGVEAASRAYFGTGAGHLEVEEAALLAGMISAPARFDPERSPAKAKSRRDWVLSRMLDLGYIDEEQYRRSLDTPIRLRTPEPGIWSSHFVAQALGQTAEHLDDPTVEGRGLQIHTTLDWFEQARAIDAAQSSDADRELALVSIEPESGDVLAYLGGHPDNQSYFDRASSARRQVGSLVKPFAFAVSFEQRKLLPTSRVLDAPLRVRYDEIAWRPQNALGKYKGNVTVASALRQSLNSASLRVALAGGLDRLDATLRNSGLTPDGVGPALALGAVEASPVEVALAYRSFATLGQTGPLRFVRSIVDGNGETLDVPAAPTKTVLEPAAAFMTADILRTTVRSGTAWRVGRALPSKHLAGKTGTSNEGRDAWFVGFSADRLTVVWNGRDDFSDAELWGGRDAAGLFIAFAQASPGARGLKGIDAPESVRWDRAPCNGHPEGWIPHDLLEEEDLDLRCRALTPKDANQTAIWSNSSPARARFASNLVDAGRGSAIDLGPARRQGNWLTQMVHLARRDEIVQTGWTRPDDDAVPPWFEDIRLDGPLGEVRSRTWIPNRRETLEMSSQPTEVLQTAFLVSGVGAKGE